MKKDPFLLVSLEESESKALAQVMSNDTARKILDFLSKEEDSATETELSKRLKVPLSTVHYNLQALLKANLVQTEEFHYSEKGKEVLHYSLANKLIIIAPKKANVESFKDKLKGLLPIALVSLGVAGIIHIVEKFNLGFFRVSSKLASFGYADSAAGKLAPEAAPLLVRSVADEAADLAVESASATGGGAAQAMVDGAVQEVVKSGGNEAARPVADAVMPHVAPLASSIPHSEPFSMAFWFLAGSLFVLFVLAVWYFFSTRQKK
ncbi:winged helix-turn-helix transcriptional regulator [Candidatus Woesearchaeota archaeon]|nr:winged helix-turn-helix transcriptional regulator [Candidatus Woesearchaeota archaeon]